MCQNKRHKLEVNLKKEAPRIPIIVDVERFQAYAQSGQTLLELRIGYESVKHLNTQGIGHYQ